MGKSTWIVDPSHTLAEFSVKHMMIATVKGRFGKVEGQIEVDPAAIAEGQFAGSVEVASINTGDQQRDDHLRSADFFEVEKFPTMSLTSRRIEGDGEAYRMVADLTIRGITRPVTWELTFEGTGKDPWGNERIGFTAEARIDRKEFGLTWNALLETGGIMVGDQVKIALHIEAIKQA